MERSLPLILLTLGLSTAVAQAAGLPPVTEGPPPPTQFTYVGTIPGYLTFILRNTDVTIDLGDANTRTSPDPLLSLLTQRYSDEAQVEFETNYNVRLGLTYGDNLLTEALGPEGPVRHTLPTQFKTWLRGADMLADRSTPLNDPAHYDPSLSPPTVWEAPGRAHTVEFQPGPAMGFKLRVRAIRDGLNDLRGTYRTQCALNWLAW